MLRAYLYFNAVLYVLFAIWCTFAPVQTAQQIGYTSLSRSGMSEYLVVYGGIELGLGALFLHCARSEPRFGLHLALALYLPIVAYRWATLALQWPVTVTTLAVGTLETALLLVALALWARQRKEISA